MRGLRVGLSAVAVAGLVACGGSPEREPSGSPAADGVRLAVGTATPRTERERRGQDEGFGAVAPVLERIARHVQVPVALPDLPDGTLAYRKAYLRSAGGVPTGSLTLRLPGERTALSIAYGRGSFDGCGPTNPRRVEVNGQPAVSNTSGGGVSGGPPHSAVVWPTDDPARDGTYAISGGGLRPRELLELAEQMDLRLGWQRAATGC